MKALVLFVRLDRQQRTSRLATELDSDTHIRSAALATTAVQVRNRRVLGNNSIDPATDLDQYCRERQIYGFSDTDNGSFSYGAVWDSKTVAPIPDGYDSADAAPLLCAGATVYTVLTKYGLRSQDRVGVMGIGGLGHLAIKLAAAKGAHVVVFSSSESKRQEALDYGASEFIVFKSGDEAPEDFKPVKHLLLCGSSNVDYSRYVHRSSI